MTEQQSCPFHRDPNRRAAVTATIQRARKEGVTHVPLQNSEGTPDEGRRGFNIRASLALFSEEMVHEAEDIRNNLPPFGLGKVGYDYQQGKHILIPITSLVGRRPFEIVQNGTKAVLERAANSLLIRYYNTPDELKHENNPLFTSIRELELFNPADPTRLIINGIHTAQGVMTNVLEAIPKVVQQSGGDLSKDSLMATARKNFSFVNSLTVVDKQYISGIVRLLQDSDTAVGKQPFNPSYFTLHSGNELDFTDEFSEHALQELGTIPENAFGCPARYTQAIKQLWANNLLLADRIWSGKIS